jgi:hypothetical protein
MEAGVCTMAKTNLEAFSFALLWANASEEGRLVPYWLIDF